mgnify:CR=1 FL=1
MVVTSAIDDSLYLANRPQQRRMEQSLGKDAFMKILIAQLQNQDPLNPMEDREFIAQMASFSTLEQMMNMTSMIETAVAAQNDSFILQSSQMIGKQVTYVAASENDEEKNETKTGVVKAVTFKGGVVSFELDNGDHIQASDIFEIREKENTSTMIGK